MPRVKQGPSTPWYIWLAVAAIVVFCLFAFYWLINISLKSGPDLSSSGAYPPNPRLKNYKSIFENDFTRALLNSAIVASVVISIPLILLVLFFQKRIVAGLTAGAVKG
jgi:multiple sugar transport system permease protein